MYSDPVKIRIGKKEITVTVRGKYGRDDEQFKTPTDIVVTPSGNILVADTGNNCIQC